ncbi:hypothetical protein [Hymenobacter sp. PAMC 26628]|uniref:hypothetical protein n=1 Tax=Hymenobacter sp. PAMC 26628 TaxID=1484118 RepID=UPI000AC2B4C6|nr:hypothetical protein [Hymenobacter sp. PAMC 26628]
MKTLLLALLPGLLPGPAPAGPPQVLPPRLAGQWRQHAVAFMARRVLTAEEQEHLNDSAVAVLNAQLRQGRAAIVLTLRPGGGYRYARAGPAGALAEEAGTCRFSRDTLYLRPAAGPPALLPPALRVVRRGRRVLVLEFPFGDPVNKISEQLLFRRE